MTDYLRKIALVRYKREWCVCFIETPDRHICFGPAPYGGKNLKEAEESARRLAGKWDFEYVGRLDKYEGAA